MDDFSQAFAEKMNGPHLCDLAFVKEHPAE
jgi:hypothetical protein